MTTEHAVLHLLDTAQVQPQPQDTAWLHLEDECCLVAPVHLFQAASRSGDFVIDVVGTLPAVLQGWNLLLG